ncbi:hypothetical protein XENORESO_011284 [Xenotaenia resolanae]|uniref:Uncharacterized protein n=1 Tax=Xenotaenia resolanae TaxID=208358 RepID=A0ABV0WVV6_9TELE
MQFRVWTDLVPSAGNGKRAAECFTVKYINICFYLGLHSGAVGSTVALQQEGPGFDPRGSFCMEFACSPRAWVLTGYSGFLPQSKDMPVRLIGLSKIALRCMNECVRGCLCVALRWTGDLSRVDPASCP